MPRMYGNYRKWINYRKTQKLIIFNIFASVYEIQRSGKYTKMNEICLWFEGAYNLEGQLMDPNL